MFFDLSLAFPVQAVMRRAIVMLSLASLAHKTQEAIALDLSSAAGTHERICQPLHPSLLPFEATHTVIIDVFIQPPLVQ